MDWILLAGLQKVNTQVKNEDVQSSNSQHNQICGWMHLHTG